MPTSTFDGVESTFQRARRPEQKLERRAAILAAARTRADRDGVRSISLADIAGDVGVHKSALLRYFETREEIFLELTAAAWAEWEHGLSVALESTALGDQIGVAGVLGQSFGDRPLFCDLLSHTPMNFERHVSVDAVRRYKLVSLGSVQRGAELLAARLPLIGVLGCREVLSTVAALAGQTWQIANPPSEIAELYRSSPELELACVEVAPRLVRTAELLFAGLSGDGRS